MDRIKYRNELKYLISGNELEIIKHELGAFMQIDEHAVNGMYTISSLYFDSFENEGFFDVDDGMDLKTKYRIRIYDHSDALIHLERKHKKNNMTSKRSCELSRIEAERLIRGSYIRQISEQSEVLSEMTCNIMSNGYKPKIIVEYDRIPFVYKHGNVRITLDMNISSSTDIRNFLNGASLRRPILPAGKHLLEVKYDAFIPEHIFNCLNDLDLQQISFSKYYLCRKYNVNGGLIL